MFNYGVGKLLVVGQTKKGENKRTLITRKYWDSWLHSGPNNLT